MEKPTNYSKNTLWWYFAPNSFADLLVYPEEEFDPEECEPVNEDDGEVEV